MKITPRNTAGWWAFTGWLLALVPIHIAYFYLMGSDPGTRRTVICTAIFVLAMAIWGIAMTLWMKARSEIIDIRELLEIKQERDRRRARGRSPLR